MYFGEYLTNTCIICHSTVELHLSGSPIIRIGLAV